MSAPRAKPASMVTVDLENVHRCLLDYGAARGGVTNEDTESEAMFLLLGPYCGAFQLTTYPHPMWVGLQNATARMTDGGKAFASVEDAVMLALSRRDRPLLYRSEVYLSTDSRERLEFIAKQIDNWYREGSLLLYR